MRALVVGAGAVGRVLAHHLARGGADVTFLVKRRHADEARRGFPLATGKTCAIVRARVVTESAELDPIDAIFLCVPSTALADDAWLRAIARATGDASIVAFGPGLDDAARVTDACGRARTVIGALGLMAWAVPAGTAYWVPPLAGVSLTGDALRVATIAAALARGGLRAKAHRDAAGVAATGAALLESIAAGLRVAGWSRRMLRRDRALTALVASSAREAIAIGAAARDATPP
ncbi:MAG TPA: 2-dehydropantoate 2-reductase, partial [Kofleriaceae bacterium]|nr:2-dehydropantoate 2-reductase [Kofleriaceae bacterium]